MEKPLEPDLIIVNMLFTQSMYPLPNSAIIIKNHGPTVVTDDGAIQEAGDHMEVEFNATDFLEWSQPRAGKSFWLMNQETGAFDKVLLCIKETKDARTAAD